MKSRTLKGMSDNLPVPAAKPKEATPKAQKKSNAGRPKGSLSKRTLDLMSELEHREFNVVGELIRTYTAAIEGAEGFGGFYDELLKRLERLEVGPNGRVQINIRDPRPDYLKVAEAAVSNLMQYVYPKRKAVELTGKDGEALAISFTELMRKAASDAPKSE